MFDLKTIKQTLSHRMTILFLLGPLSVVVVLTSLAYIDPEEMSRFAFERFLVFYIVTCVWTLATMYMLISGRWNVKRWASAGMYWGTPHALLLGYACATVGHYWPAGVMIYFTAIVGYIGYITFTQCFLFLFFYGGSFLITLFLEVPVQFQEQLVYNAAMLFSSGVVLLWIGLASHFYGQQDATIRALLRNSRKDKRTIIEERKKSDALLLSILPPSIAEELKETGRNQPVYYEQASVMFTDFQGFTRIAETMQPDELVAELDRCFSYFDSLMDRYKLEKLKTIGDSYMCAGGIPEPNRTHAIDCVLAALEIQGFMIQMKEIKAEQNLDYWKLRLGIHTGPLVAGVIGEKKFAYDVWSDTVNTASRLESSGEVEKVNVSGVTFALIKDFFDCEYRGKVAAKHKGEVDMYFVKGIKPELSRDGEGRVPGDKFKEMYDQISTR